jgi:hypothetical protein
LLEEWIVSIEKVQRGKQEEKIGKGKKGRF